MASLALEEPGFPSSSLTPSASASSPFSVLFGWPGSCLGLEVLVLGRTGGAARVWKELLVGVFQGTLVTSAKRVSCAMPMGKKS